MILGCVRVVCRTLGAWLRRLAESLVDFCTLLMRCSVCVCCVVALLCIGSNTSGVVLNTVATHFPELIGTTFPLCTQPFSALC